jgi:hypothetical protein
MGLAHRDSILKSIASDFEQWNHLVSFYCFLHAFDEILNLKFCPKSSVLLYFVLYFSCTTISLLNCKTNATGKEGKSNLSHFKHVEC